MDNSIASLIEPVKVFDAQEPGKAVNDYFIAEPNAEGAVICENGAPVGIIMRSYYYQRVGQMYGYALYAGRALSLLMKTDILILSETCDLASFGRLAMDRKTEDVYDYVVAVRQNNLLGVVSIRNYLTEIANAKEREIALLREHTLMVEQAREKEKEHLSEVQRMNRDLAVRSDAVKNLLDNAGQGFMAIDSTLAITSECSNECVRIFGAGVSGQNVLALLSPFTDESTVSSMTDIFRNVFQEPGVLRNKVYLSLLPDEIHINTRVIHFTYKVIRRGTEKQIMFILTDVTQRKQLEKKMEEEKTNMRLAVKAVLNKADIVATLNELRTYHTHTVLETLDNAVHLTDALPAIFRTVHTFKGNLAQLSMTHTSNTLHRIENELQKAMDTPEEHTAEEIAALFRNVSYNQMVEQDVHIITDTLGQDYFRQEETVAVDKSHLLEIEDDIRRLCAPDLAARLLGEVRRLRYQNFKNIVMKYNEYLLFTAGKLEKEMNDIRVTGDDVFIDAEKYRAFTKSLTNIFRNIADHAIEPPDERLDKGKEARGNVICSFALQPAGGGFTFTVQDDGRGINLDAVREKAVAKNIYTPVAAAQLSSRQLINVILLDNFSTKDSVTTISGRGMGLSAVKAETERLGGSMQIETTPGTGTKFIFHLPIL